MTRAAFERYYRGLFEKISADIFASARDDDVAKSSVTEVGQMLADDFERCLNTGGTPSIVLGRQPSEFLH